MMQRYAKFLVISIVMLFSTPIFAASYGMDPYPSAEKGFKRMAIHLQPLAKEVEHIKIPFASSLSRLGGILIGSANV